MKNCSKTHFLPMVQSKCDSDLLEMTHQELLVLAQRLREAMREHRDCRGHDRCWLDDLDLYKNLPDNKNAALALPPHDIFLTNCERYWRNRQSQGCTTKEKPKVIFFQHGDFIIEQGSVEDAQDISKLDKKLWNDWAYPLPFYIQLLELSPESVHVARTKDKRIAGASMGTISNSLTRGHIWSIDIDPEYRRNGLGTALVQAEMDFFRRFGVNEITAWISEKNLASKKLFEQLKFREKERVLNAFADGETQLLYERTLEN